MTTAAHLLGSRDLGNVFSLLPTATRVRRKKKAARAEEMQLSLRRETVHLYWDGPVAWCEASCIRDDNEATVPRPVDGQQGTVTYLVLWSPLIQRWDAEELSPQEGAAFTEESDMLSSPLAIGRRGKPVRAKP